MTKPLTLPAQLAAAAGDAARRMGISVQQLTEQALAAYVDSGHDPASKVNGAALFPRQAPPPGDTGKRAAPAPLFPNLSPERVLNAILKAVVVLDTQGRIAYWNDQAAALYGWTRDEVVGRRLDELVPTLGQRMTDAALERLARERRWVGEVPVHRRDGAVLFVRATASPISGEDGSLVGYIAVMRDVSPEQRSRERLAAEHAVAAILAEAGDLQEGARRVLQAIAEQLDLEFGELWLPDADGVHLARVAFHLDAEMSQNADSAGLVGLSRVPLLGSLPGLPHSHKAPVWVPEVIDEPAFTRADAAAALDLHTAILVPVLRGENPLGTMIFLTRRHLAPDAEVTAMFSAIGQTLAQFVERTRAEAALRENEATLQQALSAAQMGTWEIDLQSRMVRRSASTDTLFGLPPAAEPRSLDEYLARIHPDDVAGVQEAMRRTVESGEMLRLEARIVPPGDGVRWTIWRGELAHDADGAPARLRGSLVDITWRHEMEARLRELNETLEQRVAERTAELERSNQELDEFAYIASHDLRAPLRAIHTLAGWIREDAEPVLPAASQEHLARLQARAQRMEQLLDDLLDYSRAGRYRHPPELVDTGDLVRGIAELLSPPPGFSVEVDPAMPVIEAERVPLETVFRNLMSNALKHHHAPEQGHLRVSALPPAGESPAWVEFLVEDNGPGIAPEFHARIFGMFQTLRPRDQVEGSGVGLAIVKKMVESRGGRISLESDTGRGAQFRFTWPAAAQPAAPANPLPSEAMAQS